MPHRSGRIAVSRAVAIILALTIPIWLGCLSPDRPLDEAALALVEDGECGELTYENFGAEFFANYCLACHNEDLVGDLARTDAPTGINFNRLATIRQFMSRVRLRAGVQGDMPPTILPLPRPSEEERIALIQWIDCAAPSETE